MNEKCKKNKAPKGREGAKKKPVWETGQMVHIKRRMRKDVHRSKETHCEETHFGEAYPGSRGAAIGNFSPLISH